MPNLSRRKLLQGTAALAATAVASPIRAQAPAAEPERLAYSLPEAADLYLPAILLRTRGRSRRF